MIYNDHRSVTQNRYFFNTNYDLRREYNLSYIRKGNLIIKQTRAIDNFSLELFLQE